jgi:hypothetical protein
VNDLAREFSYGVKGRPIFDLWFLRQLPDQLHIELNTVNHGPTAVLIVSTITPPSPPPPHGVGGWVG